jgi:hypothetical protein
MAYLQRTQSFFAKCAVIPQSQHKFSKVDDPVFIFIDYLPITLRHMTHYDYM